MSRRGKVPWRKISGCQGWDGRGEEGGRMWGNWGVLMIRDFFLEGMKMF
jgi:hypothetical protein